MRKNFLSVLFFLLFLVGCTGEPSVEQPTEYTFHTQTITYSVEYGLQIAMDCTETNYARYCFDPSIEKSDRVQCMEATDNILARQIGLDQIPKILVFTQERFPEVFIDDHSVFLPAQDWKSPEYAANVLLAAYGAFSHYGIAYGYADWMCKEPSLDITYNTPSDMDVFDLNLLCFNPDFVSEPDITIVKYHACNFVKTVLDVKGEATLQNLLSESDTASGAKRVSDALEQYYRENGLAYSTSELRYGYGGQSFDYIVRDELATFYIYKNWKDMNAQTNPLVYEGFLHQNYPDVKAFFQINLEQMRQYQKLFALDPYNNELRVLFDNSNLSKYSFYRGDTHTIHLKNVDSLMHEYIHALTQTQSSMKAWEIKGFARYFSYRYDYYGIAFLNQDYNNLPQTSEMKYVHEYINEIQRPIDMAIDYERLENIAVWFFRFLDPNENYLSGSSFVQYLVNQYGEEAVIHSIYGDRVPLPKPYTELVSDWGTYIESNYSSYSKYVKQKPASPLPG